MKFTFKEIIESLPELGMGELFQLGDAVVNEEDKRIMKLAEIKKELKIKNEKARS